MRLVAKDKECVLKLEDKITGELFAKCPIEAYPGIAVESVTDSSRYFVLRIQDDNGMQERINNAFNLSFWLICFGIFYFREVCIYWRWVFRQVR